MEKAYKLEFMGEQTGNLYVNCCGCSQTEPLHSFGPAIKPHYLIHYVLSGKGTFVINNKKYPLKEGYGFLITPEELAFYQADSDEPWTYVWVGFNGTMADELIKKIGLAIQNPIFKSERSNELYEVVKDMMEHNTFEAANDLRRNGLLNIFLSIIAESTSVIQKSEVDRGNVYVRRAIEFIQRNYCNPIKVTDIANYVCINRSYLYTLFEQSINLSPQKFLSVFRLTKATELLQLTQLPIESIALSCGYNDPLVFAKAFKQMKGVSPSAYRKEILNDERKRRRNKEHLQQVENFIIQTKKAKN